MRLLSLAALSLASLVNANFHISTVTNTFVTGGSSDDTQTLYKTCPSNYWNCDCYANNDRAGDVNTYGGDLGSSFFSVSPMCGVGQMNFYANNGGLDGYLNGGDGSVIANCYSNSATKNCVIVDGDCFVEDSFVEWMRGKLKGTS
ncbi:hypothetical protein OEA41_006498 [Lepraria neglecta]|uniref:Uncharacterized protein n=1 Tax=Lepraria neglecta TaxID=209136 RepID=A0AAE0DKJ3_9LECA|nr:hypothetical protein OEA41_006498 [Lepraria neglecta]